MAKILDIVLDPDPMLRKKSQAIDMQELNTDAGKELIADMKLTMQEKDGVGLAAPQIGKNIRLIIINSKNGPICLANPQIIKKSWRKELGEEGCLSCPGLFGVVERNKNLYCLYLEESGKKRIMRAQGMMARVIQHEIDHLDGILFIDKAQDIKKLKAIK